MILVAGKEFIPDDAAKRLTEIIKDYPEDGFNSFLADIGWEDWMNIFVDDDKTDDDDLSEREVKVINDTLRELWNCTRKREVDNEKI